jgi:hypothetical protein
MHPPRSPRHVGKCAQKTLLAPPFCRARRRVWTRTSALRLVNHGSPPRAGRRYADPSRLDDSADFCEQVRGGEGAGRGHGTPSQRSNVDASAFCGLGAEGRVSLERRSKWRSSAEKEGEGLGTDLPTDSSSEHRSSPSAASDTPASSSHAARRLERVTSTNARRCTSLPAVQVSSHREEVDIRAACTACSVMEIDW